MGIGNFLITAKGSLAATRGAVKCTVRLMTLKCLEWVQARGRDGVTDDIKFISSTQSSSKEVKKDWYGYSPKKRMGTSAFIVGMFWLHLKGSCFYSREQPSVLCFTSLFAGAFFNWWILPRTWYNQNKSPAVSHKWWAVETIEIRSRSQQQAFNQGR